MKPSRPPTFETRRASELEAELFARARAWIPSWSLDNDERDFGRALLKIAARFGSEVTERLDRAGEKLRLGFLDWLAVRAEAARPARLPVVLKLTDRARDAKPASKLTRLQASAAGASVMLETQADVLVLPKQLQVLVGVDTANDAFYLPPPGLTSLAPLEPLPTQWQLKSFASAGATTLQLDPEQGLAVDLLIELGGLQYRITKVKGNVVTVDPPLSADQAEQSVVTKVTAFMPFDGAARNRQLHALYIGHKDLFNIEAAATIEIIGADRLTDVTWEFWSKGDPQFEDGWRKLERASPKDQARADGLVLNKPKGTMEVRALVKGGSESRWIRASANTVRPGDPPLLVDAFEICINCRHGAPPPPTVDPAAAPLAEAMANTTPLVLDSVFFPFGKEPRQFDTFYLGSKEAFSKKGADVVLDFKLADTTFTALSLVRQDITANPVFAGVALDGALYLLEMNATTGVVGKFRGLGSLRPPPTDGNTDVSAGIPLNRQPPGRLPVWSDAQDPKGFLVATTAGDFVWVRRENSGSADASEWIPFDSVPSTEARANEPIADIVYLADPVSAPDSKLVALRGDQISVRKWPDTAPWAELATKDADTGASIVFDAIAPVLVEVGGTLTTTTNFGLIGISDQKQLYLVSLSGACQNLGLANVSGVRPVAVLRGNDLFIAFRRVADRNPALFRLQPAEGGGWQSDESSVVLPEADAQVQGFDAAIVDSELNFLASVQLSSGGYVASWTAPATGPIEPFRTEIPAGLGKPVGAPTVSPGRVIVPATGGHMLVTAFDLSQRLDRHAEIVGETVFTPAPVAFRADEFLAREILSTHAITDTGKLVLLATQPKQKFSVQTIAEVALSKDGEAFYRLEAPFEPEANGTLYGFHVTDAHDGDIVDGKLKLDALDANLPLGSVIRTWDNVGRRITAIEAGVATVDPDGLVLNDAGRLPYIVGVPVSGRVSPFIRLDAANSTFKAALLQNATLIFPGSGVIQSAKAFQVDGADQPILIELSRRWRAGNVPDSGAAFIVDASAGSWARMLDDVSINPELSWEYWNGTGWWKLVVTRDETLNLKVSGKIEFKVPLDLAATDWAGRTNYWIRARLVGGDYGREKVTVAISKRDKKTGLRHQTIERSTSDIHPPSVVSLVISYEICASVLPDFVMTRDSGSLRDQSDANRTGGAKVEAFVPLALQLARLSGPPTAAAAPATAGRAAPRALYLGFDAPLLGEPVNVLLLVEERPHDDFAPMTVEVLIANRFVPVTVDDATRALGESGILSMAFAIQATPRELFGQALAWLRLTPKATASPTNWKPKVIGAYLNGVWASAAETQTREIIGSSQGEPNLSLFLARPPVLRNTLELRVREPLGEEERKALNDERAGEVLSAVENLPGDWVLWKRVIDPADEEATARVYSLDEATGEVRFGDGRHGRIPPVGRDSVMAFTYRRTDPGVAAPTAPDSEAAPGVVIVPGNTITARTALNLVSPIEGVEAVFAADQGAGGAPPEDVGRVLRYGVAGLRHRERALTARDVEDLVLKSSPDIAQARCFARNGFVQLVVVMRGSNPIPNAAQVRELHRMLIAAAPPALSARQALRIGGPELRRLRVDLKLRVASLEVAGAVAREARNQIGALFDSATGGADKEGWELGENPSGADVAVALANVPYLESIASVDLREIAADDSDQAWTETLKRNELARLEKDGVRIAFETIEVAA